jgi:hypothetical protein
VVVNHDPKSNPNQHITTLDLPCIFNKMVKEVAAFSGDGGGGWRCKVREKREMEAF